ncbi:hypothetical protein [Helicobacter pullorum]|uniref:hypothetical protein n=1 Tax=Helicobacter pullorum TaxID=35818 RepID=UPI0006BAAAAE|nr:hypothetical protein [Helicobacter pullorum]
MDNNMAKDTEFKEINNTKDTESIKLDSNGDEIVWELKKERNTINFIWSWAIICGFFLFFSWCIYLMIPLFLNSFKYFFIIVMLVILQIYILYFKFYKTFNVKRLYATKNNLILQRYIGKDMIFPLGEFFVKDIATGYGIHIFGLYSEIQIVNFYNGLSYSFITTINADKNTNFAQLKGIIESKTEQCLIGLDKQKYEFHKKVGNFLKCLKPNFNKIDKLREQKANND